MSAARSPRRAGPRSGGHTSEKVTAAALLTADELAVRWQVPKSWVYAATRDGRIPAVRLGRYYRYRLDAIEAFEVAGGASADD